MFQILKNTLPISCRSSEGHQKFDGQRSTFYHCATQSKLCLLRARGGSSFPDRNKFRTPTRHRGQNISVSFLQPNRHLAVSFVCIL